MDPLADIYLSSSPYTYVENNPILFTDPTGMYKVDVNGNIIISNEDEIAMFMDYLNSNSDVNSYTAYQHILDGNGCFLELDEVVVTGRNEFQSGLWVGNVLGNVSKAANRISRGNAFTRNVYWREGDQMSTFWDPNEVIMLEVFPLEGEELE